MRAILFYLFLPVVFLAGIANPFYGLCVYLGFNIIRPEMLFWGGSTGSIIFKVSIISTFLGYLRVRSNPRIILGYSEFWLLLWLWGACVVSLLLSNIPLEPLAWYYSQEILKLWILGCLIIGIAYKEEQLLKLQSVILGCVTFIAIWGIEQHFGGNTRLEGVGGEHYGDSNMLAAFGVLYLTIALNNAITARDLKMKLIWFISAASITAMIIFTQSRGGFLGLIGGISYLVFCARNKKMLIWIIILAGLFVSPFLANEYAKRLESITATNQDRDFSSGSRLVLWQAGILMFRDNPLFGVGLLNFAQAKMPYKYQVIGNIDTELRDYSFQRYKVGHSTYITQLLAEGGLFLTIPYIWLICGFFIESIRIRKKIGTVNANRSIDLLAGVEAGVFGYCISVIFIDALLVYFLPIQLLIGRQLIRALEHDEVQQKSERLLSRSE